MLPLSDPLPWARREVGSLSRSPEADLAPLQMNAPKSHPQSAPAPPPTTRLAKLRLAPPNRSLHNPSDVLHQSQIPAGDHEKARRHFLNSYHHQPGPVIAKSHFVPLALAEHLLRAKRDSALATKYLPGSAITNMEGAMHTFVTPLVKIEMVGDYAFRGRHSVLVFPSCGGKQQVRRCVLSATIHPDFEDYEVGHQLYGLGQQPVVGIAELPQTFQIPSHGAKSSSKSRATYDHQLRSLLVYHLTASHHLPSASNCQPWSQEAAASLLRKDLECGGDPHLLVGRTVAAKRGPLSLEMLANTYVCSLASEFSALESFCSQGDFLLSVIASPSLTNLELTAVLPHRIRLHLRPSLHLRRHLLCRAPEPPVPPRPSHCRTQKSPSFPPHIRFQRLRRPFIIAARQARPPPFAASRTRHLPG